MKLTECRDGKRRVLGDYDRYGHAWARAEAVRATGRMLTAVGRGDLDRGTLTYVYNGKRLRVTVEVEN